MPSLVLGSINNKMFIYMYIYMYMCIYIYIYIYMKYLLLSFSHSVVSDFLKPHGLQHTRLLCPSPTPRVCLNSCPLIWWLHPTVSSSVVAFSSCLQSFPASGSFLMSQLFASGGQSIGASPSASVFPINIQDWFPLELTGLIFLQSKALSTVFSNTTILWHINSSALSILYSWP